MAIVLLMPTVNLIARASGLSGATNAPFNLQQATALMTQPGDLTAYLEFLPLLAVVWLCQERPWGYVWATV